MTLPPSKTPKTSPKPLLRVIIRKRAAALECDPDDYDDLRLLFAYRHPGAGFVPKYRSGEWDGMISLLRWGKVPAGLFHFRREELERRYRLTVDAEDRTPAFRPADNSDGLRPYQAEAVEAMISHSGLGGLILSATGSGKTRLAGGYFRRLVGTGVFVVDELTLLEQSRREIAAAAGEEVGIVGRSEFQPKRITAATIQTLNRHRDNPKFRQWFAGVDVLIIDEVHVALNRRSIDIVRHIRPRAVFGLTATLELNKPEVALEAIGLCGPVIFEYSIREGVEEGYLSSGKIFLVPFYDRLRGMAPGYHSRDARGRQIKIPAGCPAAEYRYHVALNKDRNDLIEDLVRRVLREGRKVILLVEQRRHLKALARRLKDVPHYALSGNVESETRLRAMREMDAGKLNLILATRVFSKGVDVQRVDCIIDATGKPSRNSVLQRYGRGVRKNADKQELHFYDISDKGSAYAIAAAARLEALEETGAPIHLAERR